MEHIVKILNIDQETYDVKRFIVEKPKGFSFVPGHSIMISLPDNKTEKRAFSFTSTNDDYFLEFFIKAYSDKDSVTQRIHMLKPGQYILLSEMFGSIRYHGLGIFLAAGAGITPMLSILRQLKQEGRVEGHQLFYSNRTYADVICRRELQQMLKQQLTLIFTREKKEGFFYGRMNEDFLRKYVQNMDKEFYVCGSDEFIADMKQSINNIKKEITAINN